MCKEDQYFRSVVSEKVLYAEKVSKFLDFYLKPIMRNDNSYISPDSIPREN